MMTHRLRDGLAFCLVDGTPVFLDVKRDRYFTVDARLADVFTAFVRAERLPEEYLARLVRAGIVEPGSRDGAPPPAPPSIRAPSSSLLEEAGTKDSGAPPNAGVAWAVACSVAGARMRLALRGFAHCMERLRARNVAGRTHALVGARAALSLAADFNEARRLLPAAPNCLTDSLALADFLMRRGANAQFVIGVRSNPHGAHCWLQTDEILLNEASDRAAAFTPILVI